MSEPTTEAGRRLSDYIASGFVDDDDPDALILAIEQEAREGYEPTWTFEEVQAQRRIGAEVARADLAARIEEYREALIWCSGSPSFGPEGEAREGWLRVCQPLLDREATR